MQYTRLKARIEGEMGRISIGANVKKKIGITGAGSAKKKATINGGRKAVMDDERDRYEIS